MGILLVCLVLTFLYMVKNNGELLYKEACKPVSIV